MIAARSLTMHDISRKSGKRALVLTRGGILGAAYQIGCLRALDRVLDGGLSSKVFDMFVGVSAGSIIASLVANRLSAVELYDSIDNDRPSVLNFQRSDIYSASWLDAGKWMLRAGREMVSVLRHHREKQWTMSATDALYLLQERFAAGFLSPTGVRDYLKRVFGDLGLIDDFRKLDCELYVPAIDLDTGERVVFGEAGWDHVPITEAITASSSVPVFFRPHLIGGRPYIDGAVLDPAHLEIAVAHGATLIVVINPLVPLDAHADGTLLPALSSGRPASSIGDLGISFVLAQSERIASHVKLMRSIDVIKRLHPEVDLIVLEPRSDEMLLFLHNPMSYEPRKHVMRSAHNRSLKLAETKRESWAKIFDRHGLGLSTVR